MLSPWFSFVALPVLAATAGAQSVSLVLEGDVIPGAGRVIDVYDVAVNDQGDWLAWVSTNTGQEAVLKNGVVLLKTGDVLPPPALGVAGFQSVDLNDAGEVALILQTALGGTISVQSEEGKGATFEVELPLE